SAWAARDRLRQCLPLQAGTWDGRKTLGRTLTTLRALARLVFLACLVNLLGASLARAQTADITVTKSGPAEAAADSDVTYTVTVFNNGPDNVTLATTGAITLTDNIPGGMTFVSAAPPGCSTPSVGSGGSIVCTTPVLAA